jgi:hypothetical protein
MKRHKLRLETAALFSASILALASCNNEPKAPATADPPRYESSVTTQPGVAGGVYEHVYVVQSIVTALDRSTRHVELKDSDGDVYTFTARPEIKNLAQLHVGDKVTATFSRRMVVTVRSSNESPSMTRTNLGATARLGEKPGLLAAEETEKVARVTAIDPVKRVADLEFTDGVVKSVPIRPDVDLSRYKVGDNATIRVTTALTVLTETP